jgi:two-component system, LytTR family, response regulator
MKYLQERFLFISGLNFREGIALNQLTIVIADDDLPSRTLLKEFINLFPEYQIVGEASNGEELVNLILKERPNIALVDINMPGINGVDAIKSCKESLPSMQTIFTTGYDQFAVEAFNLSAIDYVIKPVDRIRLYSALERAKKNLSLYHTNKSNLSNTTVQRISIKSNNRLIYLTTDDILFIEVESRKTIVNTHMNSYETTDTLQEFETRLPDYFYKTHRSYLVNLKKITLIEPSGETFLAHFKHSSKVAHISKLKINDVQALITN